MRLYVIHFQPSFKLVEKTRCGAKVTKRYDKPATPCDRLLGHDAVSVKIKEALREQRAKLDPEKPRQGFVPVRTFADWDEPLPGFLEIDFVAHCGGALSGAFIHSLVATDVCSGWAEAIPLLAREYSLVVEGVEVTGRQLPVTILGIDSDNDGAFINETLVNYCANRVIEFTRSRPYRKNDQAWIE